MYYSRAELEEYRRHHMSVMHATEFFPFRRIDPNDYEPDEHLGLAVEMDGSIERDFNELELRLAQEAKDKHYEWVTNIVPSHGPKSMGILACGFRRKRGA